jgi:quinol monooxygenase YgiN
VVPYEQPAIPQQSCEVEKNAIKATIRMAIPSQKSDEVLKILRSVAEPCREDPGCISCHIYRDLQEKNVLMLEEVWKTREDLDTHIRSDEYRNLLLALETAVKQPEIRFETIMSSTGIEIIQEARGNAR